MAKQNMDNLKNSLRTNAAASGGIRMSEQEIDNRESLVSFKDV